MGHVAGLAHGAGADTGQVRAGRETQVSATGGTGTVEGRGHETVAAKPDGYGGSAAPIRGLSVQFALKAIFATLPPLSDEDVESFWKNIDKLDDKPATLPNGQQGTALDVMVSRLVELTKNNPNDPKNYQPDAATRAATAEKLTGLVRMEKHRVLEEGYPTWTETNQDIESAVLKSHGGGKKKPTPVSSPVFAEELEKLVGGKFRGGNSVALFGFQGNHKALEERKALIAGATQSIDLAVWKLYGDECGAELTEALIAKKKAMGAEFSIRVMVDGNVAARDPKSEALLAKLEANGIQVMRWKDAAHPMSGMHFKGLFVDAGTTAPKALVGGRNVGEEYMVDGNWRDTDIRYDGLAVLGGVNQFRRVWNAGVENGPRETQFSAGVVLSRSQLFTEDEISRAPVEVKGDARILQVVDVPGPKSEQAVTKALVKAIEGAQKRILIENAYFMDVPAVMDALRRAKARNPALSIEIVANSDVTNNHPEIMRPINQTLRAAVELGAKVYAMNGTASQTLHSKFMIVDDELAVVGSWNQHPRSVILEAEGMAFVLDKDFTAKLAAEFQKDRSNSTPKPTADSIVVQDDAFRDALERLGLAQL